MRPPSCSQETLLYHRFAQHDLDPPQILCSRPDATAPNIKTSADGATSRTGYDVIPAMLRRLTAECRLTAEFRVLLRPRLATYDRTCGRGTDGDRDISHTGRAG